MIGDERQADPGEESGSQQKRSAETSGDQEFTTLSVDEIDSNPYQPRDEITEESLESLVESIDNSGVIQPLVVTEKQEGTKHSVYVVAGERRLEAAKRAGLSNVPVIFRDLNPQELLEVALVENVQREDLNPVEKAQALERLYSEFDLSLQEISEVTGFSSSKISNVRRLLELEEPIQEALRKEDIQAGHARTLLALTEESDRLRLLNEIVRNGYSVRKTEERVEEIQENGAGSEDPQKTEESEGPSDDSLPPYLSKVEERLEMEVGTRVQIQTREEGGEIQIQFTDEDELEAILSRMGVV